jgi:hypothetical protein
MCYDVGVPPRHGTVKLASRPRLKGSAAVRPWTRFQGQKYSAINRQRLLAGNDVGRFLSISNTGTVIRVGHFLCKGRTSQDGIIRRRRSE